MDEALKQLIALGRGHFEKRQYAEAERFLSQVVEQNQSFADVYNMLGVAYHDAGQFARAQRAFETALRINPAYTEASLNLAVIYNDLGKYPEARKAYEAALAATHHEPGELDAPLLGKIANMYAEIGDAYSSARHWQGAIGEYRRALALCPSFIDIRLKLAVAYRESKEHTRALEEYVRVLEQNPDFVAAYVGKGLALHALQKQPEAVAAWEEALRRDPGHKGAEMYLSLARGRSRVTVFALKFISGKYQGGEFPLKPEKQVVIGRSSELDMVLVEDMVSRKHAKISVANGKIVIEDLGSTNGTFVNGEKVKQARLKEGDRILIGTSILKLVQMGAEAAAIDDNAVKRNLEEVAARSQARGTKASSMTGKIEEIPLPDLLQLFHTSKKNGVLVIRGPREGKIYLRQGRVFYAVIDENHELGPQKSFSRIISWEQGDFELRPAEVEHFDVELEVSTEALLMDALRLLDEGKRLARELPPPTSVLSLALPLNAPLRDLQPEHLDIIQLVHNYGSVQGVLDHAPLDDVQCSEAIIFLIRNEYLQSA